MQVLILSIALATGSEVLGSYTRRHRNECVWGGGRINTDPFTKVSGLEKMLLLASKISFSKSKTISIARNAFAKN